VGSNLYRKQRELLKNKQLKLDAKLKELREKCPHENLKYKLCGDTGNWCKADDSYWIEWRCDDCEARWSTNQDDVHMQTTKQWPQAVRVREWN